MRGRVLLATAVAAVALGAAPAASAPAPTRIGVRGDEFSLVLSRTRVPPGPAIVQFQNVGEDPHDLKLQRAGGATVFAVGELESGEVATLPQIGLRKASTYRLWCSLENHVSYGMETTMRVRRRR